MIISYSRNFIFIKTKKTAGTTVEAVLSTGCGPEDIIPNVYGSTYPGSGLVIPGRQNMGLDDESSSEDDDDGIDKNGFNPHITAEELREFVGPEFWKSAFKVTVERHPYEKAVSQAYFRMFKRNRHNEPFPIFLDRVIRKGGYSGFPLWSVDGKVAVDDFIRQENLQSDLERVTKRLGIPLPKELPEMKSRTRGDKRPAREILTEEQKRQVYENCREDFEILGYER
jgi:hypothetical protein